MGWSSTWADVPYLLGYKPRAYKSGGLKKWGWAYRWVGLYGPFGLKPTTRAQAHHSGISPGLMRVPQLGYKPMQDSRCMKDETRVTHRRTNVHLLRDDWDRLCQMLEDIFYMYKLVSHWSLRKEHFHWLFMTSPLLSNILFRVKNNFIAFSPS